MAHNSGALTMRRTLVALVVVSSMTVFSVPAFAGRCGTAGLGVFIDVNQTGSGAGGVSCYNTGTGTLLNTGASTDPVLSTVSGVSVLDTTQPLFLGTPTLNVSFTPNGLNANATDGTFSFNATGLSNVKIGFQLQDRHFLDANPDWFVFNLLPPVTGNGNFDADNQSLFTLFFELPADDIQYVVLYGTTVTSGGTSASTPLPAAIWLMGSVLGGGAGFGAWRKRKQAKAS